MVIRMAFAEFCRLASRLRLWAFVVLACAYGASASWFETPAVSRGAGVEQTQGLYLAVSLQTLWLLVIGISLVAGGSFADDRRSGYVVMQLCRGATKTQVLTGRLGAALAIAFVSTLAAASFLALYAAIVGSDAVVDLSGAVPFVPHLLEASPAAYAALAVAVYGLAAAALLASSLLIGALSSARFLSEIGPPLGALSAGFAMTGPLQALNPLERASYMQFSGASWTTPESMLLYWGGALGLVACAALLATRVGRGR